MQRRLGAGLIDADCPAVRHKRGVARFGPAALECYNARTVLKHSMYGLIDAVVIAIEIAIAIIIVIIIVIFIVILTILSVAIANFFVADHRWTALYV